MDVPDKSRVTRLLADWDKHNSDAKAAELIPLVYDELRHLAANYLRGERPNHTLQPTALVHEAYLRLADQTRVDWQSRTHFYAVCANVMRRVLLDTRAGGGVRGGAVDSGGFNWTPSWRRRSWMTRTSSCCTMRSRS